MKQVAPLRYGVIFKKAFCDPEIFTAFVRDMIGVTIEIDHVEIEKEFAPPIGRVQSRSDLFAQDVRNRVIVIILHEHHAYHYDRFMHRHIAALVEQVANAEDYRPPMKVFTIVVLTSGDRHKRDVSVTDFAPRDMQGNALRETPHKVLYLCPKYVSDDTPEQYREWLLAIRDTLDGEVEETDYHLPEIQKLFDHIEKDSVSPEERARMFDEHGQELLQDEKFAEGEKQKAIETARKMKTKGYDTDEIADLTGLSVEEINAIDD
ncbi:hypothetical protein QUF72_14340 [Desulfobacterales bacterium HSG2]|nr:hypothetical protein [Desulfobacterales bacterium HSG2]